MQFCVLTTAESMARKLTSLINFSRVGVTTRGEVLILFLPMFHIYGLVAIGSTAHFVGSKLILISRFNADDYLRLIHTYQVNIYLI